MGDSQPRHMKYPYTFTAKLIQFPWKYYYEHAWMARYMVFSTIICLPIFYKIQKLSFSPENVKKWDEMDRKALSGGH